MVIPSTLVLCIASSTGASDQVLDLPEVVVQPSLILLSSLGNAHQARCFLRSSSSLSE